MEFSVTRLFAVHPSILFHGLCKVKNPLQLTYVRIYRYIVNHSYMYIYIMIVTMICKLLDQMGAWVSKKSPVGLLQLQKSS